MQPNFLTVFIVLAIAVWLVVSEVLYRSGKAKQRMLDQCPSVKAMHNNMYMESKWICRMINNATTYAELCEAGNAILTLQKTYAECEGIEDCAKKLKLLAGMAHRLIRQKDTGAPIDIRYSPE